MPCASRMCSLGPCPPSMPLGDVMMIISDDDTDDVNDSRLLCLIMQSPWFFVLVQKGNME